MACKYVGERIKCHGKHFLTVEMNESAGILDSYVFNIK